MNTIEHLQKEAIQNITRRHFLSRCSTGMGGFWLAQQALKSNAENQPRDPKKPASPLPGHIPGRAKHVIYMHMTGSPSQLDLFDYKPLLVKLDGKDCPSEFLQGRRFAFIQGVPQLLGPQYPFHQESKTGQWISDRLPFLEKQMDKICVIKSMQSDQFNHAPAQLLAHTGNQNLGHASIGSWVLYGLGSENENLPGYVVLLSGGQIPDAGKAAWASGYLPSVYQGVQCRGEGDPVLYLSNPSGITTNLRREMVETLKKVNQRTFDSLGDTETITRIAQYEMAFRMQLTASEAMDITKEPESMHELYGTQPGKESFANNCLLARRLVERGVRYIQLYDWGWDHHSGLDKAFPEKCKQIDQPMAALLQDLEARGLLDETLIVWSGEFGRTPMQENRGGVKAKSPGRDHHIDAYTLWMAGAGIRGGYSYGETDDIGFGAVVNPVHVRDLHATMLNRLGLHDQKLTYPFLGLDARLTGVAHPSYVLKDLFS